MNSEINNLTYGVEKRENREYFRMIRAYIVGEEDQVVGDYKIHKSNWKPVAGGEVVMESWMNSNLRKRGIPRGLFKRATEVLQDLSNEKRTIIEHQTSPVNKDAKTKLKHLLKEFDYRKLDENLFVRVYHPNG